MKCEKCQGDVWRVVRTFIQCWNCGKKYKWSYLINNGYVDVEVYVKEKLK